MVLVPLFRGNLDQRHHPEVAESQAEAHSQSGQPNGEQLESAGPVLMFSVMVKGPSRSLSRGWVVSPANLPPSVPLLFPPQILIECLLYATRDDRSWHYSNGHKYLPS